MTFAMGAPWVRVWQSSGWIPDVALGCADPTNPDIFAATV